MIKNVNNLPFKLLFYISEHLSKMSTPDISSELEADWEDDGEKNIKKHSLDSDEDDDDDVEEKTYDIMAEDDIEGKFLNFLPVQNSDTGAQFQVG